MLDVLGRSGYCSHIRFTALLVDLSVFFTLVAALSGCAEIDLGEPVNVYAPDDGVTQVAIIGDYGTDGEPTAAMAAMVHSFAPLAIVTAGDNSYTDFGLDNAEANIGNHYCDYIYNPSAPADLQCAGRAANLRQNLFFPAIGNHDYKGDEDLDGYLSYFELPGNEKYYSVRLGSIEFFILDSQRWGTYLKQRRWLEEATEASTAPFRVAVFHYPPYSTGHHGDTEQMRWDFDDYGIQLVVSGHDHDYQRFQREDVTYIVNGVGGAELRHDCGTSKSKSGASKYCQDTEFGAMFITATDSLMRVDFRSVAGGYPLRDSYTISK